MVIDFGLGIILEGPKILTLQKGWSKQNMKVVFVININLKLCCFESSLNKATF